MGEVSKVSTIASAVSITQKQSQESSRNWSITINNPTQEELAVWKTATEHHWVKEAVGQLEKGESGTPHIQGLLKTDKVRFSQVKKLFPRAHIEAARNVAALTKYVQKEDTRVAQLQQSLERVEVVTPKKLQQELASVVWEQLHHKGLPLQWRNDYHRGWIHEYMDTECHPHDYPLAQLVVDNRAYVECHAERVIDEAVGNLIRRGVFGAEYATAQMASRQALKRFLVDIVIRHANQEENAHDAQEASSAPPPSIPEEVD